MPIFVKKRPFPQTHSSLMSFFLICHAKPPAILPIYMVKKSKSVKTTLYYGPKKSIEFLLFPFFIILLLVPALIKKSINIKNGQLHFLDGGLGDLTLNKSLINWIFNIWTV